MHSVLFVDDEAAIRAMMQDYFEESYATAVAANADEALAVCADTAFDLVVSDINMPGMRGPELLAEIHRRHPQTRTMLMTAYNVDDYVRMAKEYGISSIVPKTVPFNYQELSVIMDGLLRGTVFGLSRYLGESGKLFHKSIIRSSEEARGSREALSRLIAAKFGSAGDMKLILDEIITNAIYHAPADDAGKEKYKEYTPVRLKPEEYVHLECGYDREKYGVSVVDRQGRLTRDAILYRIDRHVRGEGMLDDSGRGIHMSRLFADRLIVNIAPGHKTEVIIMNYFTNVYRGYKPLYINII
jgi:CheY-like chemotaxis protein